MQKIIIIIFAVLMGNICSALAVAITEPQSPAHSDQYLLDRAYFEDETNALTFDQVQKQRFTPYKRVLTAGYRSGTFWLRLTVAASHETLVLKIRPIFIEEIELFDPAASKLNRSGKPDDFAPSNPMVGNKYPWSASDIEASSYNFLLVPSSTEREVYLRVKSVRSYLLNAEILNRTQYLKQDRQELMVYTGYATFTLFLALWLLVSWFLHRELVLGLFTLQQWIAFLHTMLHGGLIRMFFDEHLDPLKINHLFSILVVLYPLAGILANKYLLQEYGLKKIYRLGFNILIMLSLGVITLYLSSDTSLTFNLNSLLVAVVMLYFLIAALFGVNLKQSSHTADALSIRTIRAFYTFNIALWTLAILPLQGVLSIGTFALHSIHIYSMLTGLVFFALLQYRARALLKFETGRAMALKTEADHARQQREEQSMLMAMLSHEIKTPLSVLKLVVDEKVTGSDLEGHANRAVSNIDFIVERCLQLGRLDANAMHAQYKSIDLDNFFKKIINESGAEGRVRVRCPLGLIVQTDPEIMFVVISNLMTNALKYSPAESMIDIQIHLAAQRDQEGVAITIINDTGVMGQPDPEHVFKKYYRNTAATKISGSGLGLYLVHELLKVLGGTVEYQPANNRVEFKLWIPA